MSRSTEEREVCLTELDRRVAGLARPRIGASAAAALSALRRWGNVGLVAANESQLRVCGLVFDRGEPDHWLGAFAVNWVAGEGIAAAVAIIVLVVKWPNTSRE